MDDPRTATDAPGTASSIPEQRAGSGPAELDGWKPRELHLREIEVDSAHQSAMWQKVSAIATALAAAAAALAAYFAGTAVRVAQDAGPAGRARPRARC
jgi:hypothetical protein